MSNPNIEINDKFYGSNNKFRDYSKVDTIYEIKDGLYKGLSDNEIVEKVGKDYDWTGTNYRDSIEATMMLDNDNSLKGFIKNNIGKGATSSAITAIVLNYLLKKGVSKAVAIKISPLVAGTIFAIDEVSKLKEFRNIGSNGRAALILALGKEKERGIEAAKTARWYQKKYIAYAFYEGAKKIYNEDNFDNYSKTEKLLFTKSYENWPKEQQDFLKKAIKASGKEKETEKIIKAQKLLYRYTNGGNYTDEKDEKVTYSAGNPNWYNNRKKTPDWGPYNGM
ncbi:hypothetical protein EII29_02850 [Leptotrichia sp. OH3620_COT-345]|uniref:hypothetical protein n=1 Tax=Leptotrichia sp. OH3620_COT-345 TaxID=2491048 RepID=UPI000F64CE03|nr:hypothetical protein [Leptotrichia sp. OH3620_COT-345]RRD40433.1 hypothetical protein EII29_02850 [Leptotrichia sp. OH3620_COT-345]